MVQTNSMFWKLISSSVFEYETSKVVQIKSWKIGILYRLFQLGIVLYVSLWVMYHDKGYQTFDYPVAGVTAKLKGIAFANLSHINSIGTRVWDTADFVIPPQQNSAFFVATNMVITSNQTLGYCDESTDVYGVNCKNDKQCKKGRPVHLGSGIETGRCVQSTKIVNISVCQIYGWCPTEFDRMPIPNQSLLQSAPNFTVLLKNSIEFPNFKIKRRNILKGMTKKFLYTCRYNPYHKDFKFCPIFRLGDIINYSKAKNKNIWTYGGLMSIHIEWNCNLDFNVEECVPEYTFRRLDDFKADVGKGWNFRYSYHYVENGIEKRTLMKVYGIQFFITVSGRGGKFNFFKFSMNLGSGLALLGIASVLCDLFVLNIVRKRELYKRARVDSLKSILNNRKFANEAYMNNKCKICGAFNSHKTNLRKPSLFRRISSSRRQLFYKHHYCNCEENNNNNPTFIDIPFNIDQFESTGQIMQSNNDKLKQTIQNNLLTNLNNPNLQESFNLNGSIDTKRIPSFKTQYRISQSCDYLANEDTFIDHDKRNYSEYYRLSKSTDLPFMDDDYDETNDLDCF